MRYSFQCFLSSQATECGTRPRWQKQVLFSSAKYLWNFLVKFMIDEKLFWLATSTWYHAAPLLTPKQHAGVTPGVVRVAPMQLMRMEPTSRVRQGCAHSWVWVVGLLRLCKAGRCQTPIRWQLIFQNSSCNDYRQQTMQHSSNRKWTKVSVK